MDPLAEIKSKLDIVSFVSEYVSLSRAGHNFKALCPFHKEKTPSFIVSPELQIWRCFGTCNEGGDIFKFLMKMENLEFPEALRLLAKRAGVELSSRDFRGGEREKLYEINKEAARFYNYILTKHKAGESARTYLKRERGIKDETIEVFGIGFSPDNSGLLAKFLNGKKGYEFPDLVKAGLVIPRGREYIDRFRGRIVFPLRDQRGNVLGFSGRLLLEAGPPSSRDFGGAGKYVNTPETLVYHKRAHLFGLDVTKNDIKETGAAIVVEGEFDLIAPYQTGIKNVVAIKGSTFTEEQAKLISRFTKDIVLALDQDSAGSEATKTGLRQAEAEDLRVRILDLGSFKDPDEAVRADKEGLASKIKNAKDAYDYFIDRAFNQFNAKTTDGVRNISRELSPLISQIKDSIVRAHHVKNLAERLGISDTAVAGQIDRFSKPRREEAGEEDKKPRRKLLEERIFSLSLRVRPEFLLDPRFEKLIAEPVLLRVRVELAAFLKSQKQNFKESEFVKSLPPELFDAATKLLLNPLDENEDPIVLLRDLENTTEELERMLARDRINEIARIMKEKEKEGLPAEKEQEELARLIQTLSSFSKAAKSRPMPH